MRKKILVISYTFPPYPGIGGRRWAKFAKYLAKKDYELHVICSENPFEEISTWGKDTINPNIKTHALPVNYPNVMINGAKNLIDKLIYRFWKGFFSVYSKGVIFERTIFWEKQLVKKASEVIEQNSLKNVIVSIPPYKLAAYAVKLKKKYPYLNLIVDYRDPWTDNRSFHGFKNINSKRFRHEQLLEVEVLNTADSVITVSGEMTEMLKRKCLKSDKVVTILNGYDPDDIILSKPFDTKPIELKFVYGGTLYSNLDYIIGPLLLYMDKLKERNLSLYKKISFEFYGEQNPELAKRITSLNSPAISIHKSLPLTELQEKIRESKFCVLMSAADHSFAFNTKFFEYIANRKPILLFSNPGSTSEFIINNKLGFCVNPKTIEKDLDVFFSNMESIMAGFNSSFNIEPFSVSFLTNQVEKLFK